MTLKLTKENLRKSVNPEKDLYLTDLDYESYSAAHKANHVVYTSPSGKVQTLKDRRADAEKADGAN